MPLQCNEQASIFIASVSLLEVGYTIAKQRRLCIVYESRTVGAEQTLNGGMLSSLRNGSKALRGCSKGQSKTAGVGNFASWQTLMLSFVCAVDWSSALAASAQQSAGTVGTSYQNITSLLSLRNFTTEQRGTTVLCVRKLDKVMQMQYLIIEKMYPCCDSIFST